MCPIPETQTLKQEHFTGVQYTRLGPSVLFCVGKISRIHCLLHLQGPSGLKCLWSGLWCNFDSSHDINGIRLRGCRLLSVSDLLTE